MSFINKTIKAFTIIELMVGIFVTLIAIGTFFKLYTNSIKAERSTNLRSSVSLLGDQMIENISNSIRLLGLNSEYSDFDAGTVIAVADGGTGVNGVNFRFLSPYGGPITQLSISATGAAPNCVFTVSGSAAFHSGLLSVQIVSNAGIYSGTGLTIAGNVITPSNLTDSSGAVFAGNCSTAFPAGTLVTGPNNNYTLTYAYNSADDTVVKLSNTTTGEDVVNFISNAGTAYRVPYFVFQFLREYIDASGTLRRVWISELNVLGELKEVKAVRVGFVILSTIDRTKKKISTSGMSTTVNYCPFEGMCYSLNDINKTAYVFRRVIHIRNYDYLKRNADISY